ncbi:MAG: ABC transporter substrate-binding protein [Polyangiaceae bacterium]
MTFAGTASAESAAETFFQAEQAKLQTLLRQPASPARDAEVTKVMDRLVDYDELTRRAFGQPCPGTLKTCTDHWSELNDAQKTQVKDLLKKLIEKNYRKNLVKTLDFDITYKGAQEVGTDSKIRTEAKNKVNTREPSVRIEYLMGQKGASTYVVKEITTEGSSLTKNYYDQFHKMLTTADQGFPHIVKKLTEKLAKKD